MGRLGLRFCPTSQDGLPGFLTPLLLGESLCSRLAAFSSQCYRVWVFHALSLYVALGIVNKNICGKLHFSLDIHT